MSFVSNAKSEVEANPHFLNDTPGSTDQPSLASEPQSSKLVGAASVASMSLIGPILVRGLLRSADLAILLFGVIFADVFCSGMDSYGFAQNQLSLGVLAFGGVLAVFRPAVTIGQTLRNMVRLRLVTAGSALAWGSLAATLWSTVISGLPMPPAWLVAWIAVAAIVATAGIILSARPVHALGSWRRLIPRVAVVGTSAFSHSFARRMLAQTASTTFLGLYDDGWDSTGASDVEMPVLGDFDALLARARHERIDAVVLAMPLADMERIMRTRAALAPVTADIYLATEVTELICRKGSIDRLGASPVVRIASRPLAEWQLAQKAIFDWVLGSVLLAALSPALLLVTLAVRIDSPGPALFRQRRRGYNSGTFEVFKFRTMYTHLSDANADRQTTHDDPRVTRLGRFLRKTSIDELPQLINVLRGEMSLVGPRPHAVNTKAGNQLFADAVADYTLRYRIKPGITGWAQVNGWRGETRTREQIAGRVAHDLYYIDNWSLLLDFRILILTVMRELNSKVAF